MRMRVREACLLVSLLSACSVTRPVVKIALVAPFEGHYRAVGYEVIYAVRLAVREANRSGGVAGHSVELMAFDDRGDPILAEAEARKASVDPQVVGVIGHWLDETTLAAEGVYAQEGVPLLATTAAELSESAFRLWPTIGDLNAAAFGPKVVHCTHPCGSLEDLDWLMNGVQLNPDERIFGPPLWGLAQFPALAGEAADGVYFVAAAPFPADSSDPSFADRYLAISNGVEPRAYAVLAYDAARVLLQAIANDVQANGRPTREGAEAALAQTDYPGLSGRITFDAERDWTEARGWVYQWEQGKVIRP